MFVAEESDFATWDNSPEWLRDFNAKTAWAYPSTYYFSVATSNTHPCGEKRGLKHWIRDTYSGKCRWQWPFKEKCHCPDRDTEIIFTITEPLLGSMKGKPDSYGFNFGPEWHENDGVVPLVSSKCPWLMNDGKQAKEIPGYDSHTCGDVETWKEPLQNPQKGKWYWAFSSRDHLQIIGFDVEAFKKNKPPREDPSDGIFHRIQAQLDLLAGENDLIFS